MFRAKWRRSRRDMSSSSRGANERQGSGGVSDPVFVDYPSSSLPNTPATAPPVLTSNHHAHRPRQHQQHSYLLPRHLYEAAIFNPPIHPQQGPDHSQHISHSLQDLSAMYNQSPPIPHRRQQPQASKKQSLPVLPPVASVSPFHTPTRGSSTSYKRNIFREPIPIDSSLSSSSSVASSPTRFNVLESHESNMQFSINAQGQMSIYPPASASAPMLTDGINRHSSTVQFPHQITDRPQSAEQAPIPTPRGVRPVSATSSLSNRNLSGFVHNQTPSQLAAHRASVPSLSSRIEIKTKKFFQRLKAPMKRFGSNAASPNIPEIITQPSTSADDVQKDKTKKKGSKTQLTKKASAPLVGTNGIASAPRQQDSSAGDSQSSDPRAAGKGKARSKGNAHPDSHLSTSSISLPLHLLAIQHPNPQWQHFSPSRSPTFQPEVPARKTGFDLSNRGDYQVDLLPSRPHRVSETLSSVHPFARVPPSSSSSTIPNQWKRDSFRSNADYYRPGSSSNRVEKSKRSSHLTSAQHITGNGISGTERSHIDKLDATDRPEHEENLDTSSFVKVRPSTSHGRINSFHFQGDGSNENATVRSRRSNVSASTERRNLEREHTLEIMSGGVVDPTRTLAASPRPRTRRDALSPLSSHIHSSPGSRPSSQVSRISLLPGPQIDRAYDEPRQSPAPQEIGADKDEIASRVPSANPLAPDGVEEEQQMWPVGRVSRIASSSNATDKPLGSNAGTPLPSADLIKYAVPGSRDPSDNVGFASPGGMSLSESYSPMNLVKVEPSPADPTLSGTRSNHCRGVYGPSQDGRASVVEERNDDGVSRSKTGWLSHQDMSNASPSLVPPMHHFGEMGTEQRSHWSTDSHTGTRSGSHGTVMTDDHHSRAYHPSLRSDGEISQGQQSSLSHTMMGDILQRHEGSRSESSMATEISFLQLGTFHQPPDTKQLASHDEQQDAIWIPDQERPTFTRTSSSTGHTKTKHQRHPSMQVLSQPLASTSVIFEVNATRKESSGDPTGRRSVDIELKNTLQSHHGHRLTDDAEASQHLTPSMWSREARPRKSSQRVKGIATDYAPSKRGDVDDTVREE